jgi:hypothetical protein
MSEPPRSPEPALSTVKVHRLETPDGRKDPDEKPKP